MKSAILAGAAVALLTAGSALAQPAGSSPPPTSASPPSAAAPKSGPPKTTAPPVGGAETGAGAETSATGAVNSSAMSDFKVGATVKDATGAEIGTISKLVPAAGANPASVELKVGSQTVTVPQSALTSQGGAVISSRSKAELTAGKSPG